MLDESKNVENRVKATLDRLVVMKAEAGAEYGLQLQIDDLLKI